MVSLDHLGTAALDGGLAEPLRGEAGLAVEVSFALLTQLGDVWFLFLLGGVVYVAGASSPRLDVDRRRGLFVLALVIAYVAVIEVLKPLVGFPRPPGAGEPPHVRGLPPLLEVLLAHITTADGHAFPSGHAVGSTVVWGGLALVLDRAALAKRVGVAAVVVLVVSLSRLVLGVHYLVDVVAGVGLGVFALGALYLLSEGGTRPGRVLGVAAAAGVVALIVTVAFDSVSATGGAVGGWLGWRLVADRTKPRPTSSRAVIVGLALLAVGGVLFAILYALDPAHPVTFVGSGVAVGIVVVAPAVGERLTRP